MTPTVAAPPRRPPGSGAGVRALLADAGARLGRADAEILLAHVLGCARGALAARDGETPDEPERRAFASLVERRARGEPVAYLTGHREFWSLDLAVTPEVLIPRPETELLVEWALEHLPAGAPARVLDIGTGSGAIALALARERPQAQLVASDLSEGALEVAQRNALRLEIANVTFVRGDLFGAIGATPGFDLIVSNPPYIAVDDPHLADLAFEPAVALTSGADGLEALRAIVADGPRFLAGGGWLLLEHGAEQGGAVRALLATAGFESVETRRDLAGLPRATGGRRPMTARRP